MSPLVFFTNCRFLLASQMYGDSALILKSMKLQLSPTLFIAYFIKLPSQQILAASISHFYLICCISSFGCIVSVLQSKILLPRTINIPPLKQDAQEKNENAISKVRTAMGENKVQDEPENDLTQCLCLEGTLDDRVKEMQISTDKT